MLLLTFRAAENLYAVDVTRVVEVVPRVDLRRLPHAPDFLAGLFDYRGAVVPVIDLGILLGSTPAGSPEHPDHPGRQPPGRSIGSRRRPDPRPIDERAPRPRTPARVRWLLG